MDGFILVIPSLNPDDKLIQLLQSIRQTLTTIPILIVNDGSGEYYQPIFDQAKQFNCIVVDHAVNRGKGAALKTAMQYILIHYPTVNFLVTIDSDGQHKVVDMLGCMEAARLNPSALLLGTRQFGNDVPFRSKFGNILTRNILKLITGIELEDTQTGLRVIPRFFLPALLKLKGDRFEYETNMLVLTKEMKIPIVTHPIQTVYLEDNVSSHFKVVSDSIKIYSVFIKCLVSSVMSFAVDLLAYALIINLLAAISFTSIYMASFSARAISSIFNYYVNRELVFKDHSRSNFLKYFLLVIFQIALSSLLVYLLFLLLEGENTVFLKMVVDSLLFFLSYFVQKHLIFKGKAYDKKMEDYIV